jgi:cytochrome c biogenesis protein CcdA
VTQLSKKNNIETPINEKNYTVTNKISEQIQKTKHELLNNNNNNNNTKFLFIHRTKTICYFLSNFFLYGGIVGTLISFLVLLQYTNYSYLILVAGIITSLLLWHVTGLYSDLLEWKINIADDLKQIKKAAPFKDE